MVWIYFLALAERRTPTYQFPGVRIPRRGDIGSWNVRLSCVGWERSKRPSPESRCWGYKWHDI